MSILLAAILEQALNRYLQLDPEIVPDKLTDLAGKIIAIQPVGLGFTLYLLPSHRDIQVDHSCAATPDLTIRAAPVTLIRLLSQADMDDVEIEGDSELAQSLQTLFRSIDIDWEEQLSNWIGDVGAHRLGLFIRDSRHWMVKTQATLLQNTAEYLQEEIHLLPAKFAVTQFLDAVDCLRDDTERLEARIKRVQQQLDQTL